MPRSCWIVLCLAGACHRAEPPRVMVRVTCSGDRQRQLAVERDVRLDAALCGEAWDRLGIRHGARTELVRAIAGREVWLERRAGRAVVEVRTPGAAPATYAGVTALDVYRPVAPPSVAISVAGTTRQVPVDELRRLAPAGRDISLCAVADAYAPQGAQLAVQGEAPAPVVVSRAQCRDRGLVLRVGGKGEVRLRGSGGARLLQHVRAISL